MACTDYFGIPIDIGTEVIFPASGEMMKGIITGIGPISKRTGEVISVHLKNESGYIKTKRTNILINVDVIKKRLPEYFI